MGHETLRALKLFLGFVGLPKGHGVYSVTLTVAVNGNEEWGGGISLQDPDAENVIIRNNICSQNVKYQIEQEANVSLANITVDHKLIDGFRDIIEEEIFVRTMLKAIRCL